MNARLVSLLFVSAAGLHCAHAPPHTPTPVAASPSPSPPPAAPSSSPPPATRTAAGRPTACPAHADTPSDLPGFHPDDRVLHLDGASAAPPLATSSFQEGHLVLPVPTAWFPSRVDDGNATSYRVRTEHDDDVIGLYFGGAPAFHLRVDAEFRRLQGPLAVRGNTWDEPSGEHRLEALVRTPCGPTPWMHLYVRTTRDETLRAAIEMLVHSTWSDTESFSLHEVTLDATRDAAAVAALTAGDPDARALAQRALAGEGLHARYPLAVVNPRADQVLSGRFVDRIGDVPLETWVSLPVHDGRATASRAMHARLDGTLSRAIAAIPPTACRTRAVVLAAESLGLRCTTGPDVRVMVEDPAQPDAWRAALQQALHVRAVMTRWGHDPSLAFGYPAALCTPATVRVSVDGSNLQVAAGEGCALTMDAAHEALHALALQGSCAAVPDDGWGHTLRTVGRFDEVRGDHGTACTFTLGATARGAWVIAVGDEGTASGPIATGPRIAVDPHAVQTAVAFVHELVGFAVGQTDETPANVRPSVLHALGVDRPGSPESIATVRLFFARGGFEGASIASVLSARAPDEGHAEVVLLPVTMELESQPAGWVVTSVRPTALH